MNLIKKTSIIILSVILMILLSACSSNTLETDIYNAISDNWSIYNDVDENSYINNLNERASFKIENIEKQDDVYAVTLNVTAPDISAEVEEYQNNIKAIPSDKEMNEKLKNIISNAELKTTQQTVTVFETDDGTYDVEFSSEFADAMCGYSYQDYVNQMDELFQGE